MKGVFTGCYQVLVLNEVSLGKIFPLDREKNDTCSLFTKYLLNVLKAWKPSLRAPKVSVNMVTLLARKLISANVTFQVKILCVIAIKI